MADERTTWRYRLGGGIRRRVAATGRGGPVDVLSPDGSRRLPAKLDMRVQRLID